MKKYGVIYADPPRLNIGVALAGASAGKKRAANDFYPTPPAATRALLEALPLRDWPSTVWEPACGSGDMAVVLHERFSDVIAEDLVYRGYGVGGCDFLKAEKKADAIITNPPFNLSAAFIQHAYDIGVPFMALLLKSNYWNAVTRAPLFNLWPPTRILPLTWRLDFENRGRPTMDCTWFVWDPTVTGQEFRPIAKPKEETEGVFG